MRLVRLGDALGQHRLDPLFQIGHQLRQVLAIAQAEPQAVVLAVPRRTGLHDARGAVGDVAELAHARDVCRWYELRLEQLVMDRAHVLHVPQDQALALLRRLIGSPLLIEMCDKLHVLHGRTRRLQVFQRPLGSLDCLELSWSGAICLLHCFAQHLHSIQPALSDEESLETMLSPLVATCDARSQQLLLQSKLLRLLDLVHHASRKVEDFVLDAVEVVGSGVCFCFDGKLGQERSGLLPAPRGNEQLEQQRLARDSV
eukprot:scaffold1097_cov67-Phaeocystis_antarctica.AAC.5